MEAVTSSIQAKYSRASGACLSGVQRIPLQRR